MYSVSIEVKSQIKQVCPMTRPPTSCRKIYQQQLPRVSERLSLYLEAAGSLRHSRGKYSFGDYVLCTISISKHVRHAYKTPFTGESQKLRVRHCSMITEKGSNSIRSKRFCWLRRRLHPSACASCLLDPHLLRTQPQQHSFILL